MSVQELLDRLENHYTFECEGGPLRNCVEWSELKRRLADIPVSASSVRETEPKLCQAAQYRPGGVFMFNTATRAMENCENELFVKASELDKAEAQWIRIAAEDVRDAKSAGLREAEPLKALVAKWRKDSEVRRERAAMLRRQQRFEIAVLADDESVILLECSDQLSAALEGAATHTCRRGHATEGNCRQCAWEDENARSKALDDANGR